MKTLLQIFYDILLKIRGSNGKKNSINISLIANYLEPQSDDKGQLINDLVNYFDEFYNFCFELDNNNMLKGKINFKY